MDPKPPGHSAAWAGEEEEEEEEGGAGRKRPGPHIE